MRADNCFLLKGILSILILEEYADKSKKKVKSITQIKSKWKTSLIDDARARKHYRNTLRKYLKDNPEVEEELEPEVNGTATDDINGTVSGAELSLAQMQLIGEFEERFNELVRAMIENVNDVSGDMSPGDVEKAMRALEKAEAKLQRIQLRIQNGEYDMALDYLENATNSLSDDFDDSEDPGTAQMLRTMNRFETRIHKLEQKVARRVAKGLSTDELDARARQSCVVIRIIRSKSLRVMVSPLRRNLIAGKETISPSLSSSIKKIYLHQHKGTRAHLGVEASAQRTHLSST